MALFTLKFTDRLSAEAAAKALGFWDHSKDRLKTVGQSTDPDGSTYGWSIVEIGQDPVITQATFDDAGVELTPPVTLPGFYVNVDGSLPEAATPYLAPGGYGCAGFVFAGTTPGPHDLP